MMDIGKSIELGEKEGEEIGRGREREREEEREREREMDCMVV